MLEMFVLMVLIILSVIDIIWKKFPAGFLTGLIFLVGLVSYINRGEVAIIYGLFSFIIAWMMIEFETPIKGIADLKLMTLIGFMLLDLRFLFLFIVLIMVLGIIYQIALTYLNMKKGDEVAFIPVITVCYIALYYLGGLVG